MVLLASFFPGPLGNVVNFLAISVVFAMVYYIMQKPNSWTDGKRKTLMDCLYFAFMIQSTTGFGDIAPTDGVLRVLVMIHILVAYSLPLFVNE